MPGQLKILIVDDTEDDALLCIRSLQRAGYALDWQRVSTPGDLRTALANGAWDVALCDYTMPGFGAPEALEIFREVVPRLPVLIVSGTVGEETAVEAMRLGASDYLLKDRLVRLGPAIERSMNDARMRLELERSRAMLVKSEKLRALGLLAAGVSHDLTNVLVNPLTLFLDLLQRQVASGEARNAVETVTMMKEIVRDGTKTIGRLRNFGRPADELHTARVNLADVARDAIRIASASVRTGTPLRTDIVPELKDTPLVVVDGADVANAVVNLIVNAIDAMPKGGLVHVRTGFDQTAFIEVADQGPGIPEELREKIFEPFFTTKGDDGTGLGLAMVRACVKNHDGKITVDSTPGGGTRFRLGFNVEKTT